MAVLLLLPQAIPAAPTGGHNGFQPILRKPFAELISYPQLLVLTMEYHHLSELYTRVLETNQLIQWLDMNMVKTAAVKETNSCMDFVKVATIVKELYIPELESSHQHYQHVPYNILISTMLFPLFSNSGFSALEQKTSKPTQSALLQRGVWKILQDLM